MTGLSSSSKFYSLYSCNILLFCRRVCTVRIFSISNHATNQADIGVWYIGEAVPNVSRGIKFFIRGYLRANSESSI